MLDTRTHRVCAAVESHLSEIDRTPRLTAEGEREVAGLIARESTILRLRFATEQRRAVQSQTGGERLGYTRERIRQIERNALAKQREQTATQAAT